MKMVKVDSSNIDRIGYDARNKSLDVLFKNGGRYRYKQVPKGVYTALSMAESVGSYLHKNIKPNYEYEKINE